MRGLARRLGSVGMVLTAALPAPASLAARQPVAGETIRVFFDNDFLGPGQSNIQAMIPLMRDPRVRLEGVGVVTGDAWLTEEVQHLLRFLEIAQRRDIKVHAGAEMPLLRTPVEMANWEAAYGKVPFKGAWSTPRQGRTYHPDQPRLVPPLTEGAPMLKPAADDAVTALIRAVRAHPGEVTIVAAGPLTNIALALRVAPDLPDLAKAIVIEAGKVDTGFGRATGNTDYATDFNFLFDPEAAHIVLTAPWKRITAVGNVSSSIKMTPELADRIAAAGKPVGSYVKRYARLGQPLWDEITVAVALDPTLVTEEVVAHLDVETQRSASYGQPLIWKSDMAPAGTRAVHLVRAIDAARFTRRFVEQAAR